MQWFVSLYQYVCVKVLFTIKQIKALHDRNEQTAEGNE